MILVTAALPDRAPDLPAIPLWVERRTLAKRLWRGTAEDGVEFGFDLVRRLTPDAVIHRSESAQYIIRQHAEPCLEIPFSDDLPPSAVAGIAWSVGNLHLEFSATLDRMITPDEPAARRLLDRIGIPFAETTAVCRPGHFKRHAAPPRELGASHRHDV